MTKPNLTQLEKEASDRGLLLRIQVRRPLNIWSFKLVVGEKTSNTKITKVMFIFNITWGSSTNYVCCV